MIGNFSINSPLPGSSGPVDINLEVAYEGRDKNLKIDKKVVTIMQGYLKHPDRQGLLSTISNKIREFFNGKTAIKINVVGEKGKISSVYVKINDLEKTKAFQKNELKALKNKEIEQKTTFIMARVGKKEFEAYQGNVNKQKAAISERKVGEENFDFQKHFASLMDDRPLLDDEESKPIEREFWIK